MHLVHTLYVMHKQTDITFKYQI